MTRTRRSLMETAAVVILGAAAVQCQAPASERKTLIQRLVQKADAVRSVDKQEAGDTYSMAIFFADDKGMIDELQGKFRSLDVPSIRLSEAQMKRASEVLHSPGVDLDACAKDWPARTPASDVVNLKMLLNDKLFSTLISTSISFSGGSCYISLAAPRMSMADARTTFGPPTATVPRKDGSEVFTYGVFKIGGDKDGNAAAIMFAGKR